MRRLILATVSVLALAIGAAAASHAANLGNTSSNAGRNMLPRSQITQPVQTPGNLSKDEIRQAQLELRNMGLYAGSLDGVVGPETRQAIEQFQKGNGLRQTATLDQPTMERLIGNGFIGQGSSAPPIMPHGTAPGSSSSGGLR